MKSKLIPQTKLSGITLTTLLIIVFSFILFFFVSVKNKESRITERGFRILNQYVTNLNTRLDNYEAMAKNEHKKQNVNQVFKNGLKIDSVMGYKSNLTQNIVLNFTTDDIHDSNAKNAPCIRDENSSDTKNYNSHEKLKYSFSVGNLVNDIFGDEVFEDYVLIKDDTILYKTLDYKFELEKFSEFSRKALIENNTTRSLFSRKKDSSLNSGRYLNSGFVADVSIAQTKYKLFVFPILPTPHNGNKAWYLGGLIKTTNFIKAKRSVSSWIIILITLFFIAVIISFPIVKLFILNAIERIQGSNIYFAGAALIFGVAILNIFYLNQLTAKYLVNNSEKRIKYLNDTIKQSFENEINEAYNTLKWFDTNSCLNQTQYDIISSCLFEESIKSKCCKQPNEKNSQLNTDIYKYFKTAFWMDSTGQQLMELRTRKDPMSNLVNLGHRDYFKKYNECLLPYSDCTDTCFFGLQSIYSNTTGEALVALSTASKKRRIPYKLIKNGKCTESTLNAKVAAIISPMNSIIETVLPKGFEFRIIDGKGKVWFHSNKSKNLQENLFVESNYNKDLISSVNGRNDLEFKMELYNNSYYAYSSPINNLPLYLVTVECKDDNIYQNAQITLILLFYLAAILLSGILFVIILVIIATQKNELLNRSFALNWGLPRPNNLEYYKVLTLANIFQILVLLVLILFVKLFYIEQPGNALFFGITIFIINILFAFSLLDLKARKYKVPIKSPFMVWSVLILLALSIWYSIYHPQYILYMGVIFLEILCFGVYRIRFKSKQWFSNPGSIDYIKAYRYYFLSLMILISVITPAYVYKTFFVETSQLILRHQQSFVAKQTEKRNSGIDEYFNKYVYSDIGSEEKDKLKKDKKEQGLYSKIYLGTIAESKIYLDSIAEIDSTDKNKIPNWLSSDFYMLSWMFGEKNNQIPDLSRSKASDEYWEWLIIKDKKKKGKLFSDKKLRFSYKTKSKRINEIDFETKYMESELPVKSPMWIGSWRLLLVYTLVILLSIFFLNLLLKRLLIKMFFNSKFITDKKYKLKHAITEIKDLGRNGVFVNKLGYEATKKYIKHAAESKDKNNYHILEYGAAISKMTVQENDIYFYFGLSNNKYKLKSELEQISAFEKKCNTIIIVSNYTPKQIIKKFQSPFNNQITDEDLVIASQLKAFFTKYITYFIEEEESEIDTNDIKTKIIKDELSASNYLLDFKKILLDLVADNIKEIKEQHPECEGNKILLNKIHKEQYKDSYILKIKSLADSYYQHIWDTCTPEERFILFDLADDSITNLQNRDELMALIANGLIKHDNGFELMNKSFAQFIIDHTNINKLIFMEFEAKRKGGWNKFRLPLILIGLSIGVFIITTQQDLVSNLYGVLISIGGVIGIASRFNVMFNKGAGGK